VKEIGSFTIRKRLLTGKKPIGMRDARHLLGRRMEDDGKRWRLARNYSKRFCNFAHGRQELLQQLR
jgi:hypothetical protein